MGRRGPAPEPTALKLAKGVRSDRVNADEAVLPSPLVPPSPPTYLEPDALEHWFRLAPTMHAAGLLTDLDVDLLASFCELLVTKQRVREMISRGLLKRGRSDELVTNPAWRIYRDLIDRERLLARELGLSPSARSTIKVAPPAAEEAGESA